MSKKESPTSHANIWVTSIRNRKPFLFRFRFRLPVRIRALMAKRITLKSVMDSTLLDNPQHRVNVECSSFRRNRALFQSRLVFVFHWLCYLRQVECLCFDCFPQENATGVPRQMIYTSYTPRIKTSRTWSKSKRFQNHDTLWRFMRIKGTTHEHKYCELTLCFQKLLR